VFVDNSLISRVHAILSWQGGWVLTDNRGTNGMFIDGRRATEPIHIDRPIHLRLGDPTTGPLLSLARSGTSNARNAIPHRRQRPQLHRCRWPPRPAPSKAPVRQRPSTAPISRANRIPANGLSIGRTGDNDIVVDDVLACR
jgi:pSer/pThr/pTyr-binding forkhead associated (FHA) protein